MLLRGRGSKAVEGDAASSHGRHSSKSRDASLAQGDNGNLRKLNRAELLEILVDQSHQIQDLKARLDEANARLADRSIVLQESGSIAEAALRLNGIFEAADAACRDYLASVGAVENTESDEADPVILSEGAEGDTFPVIPDDATDTFPVILSESDEDSDTLPVILSEDAEGVEVEESQYETAEDSDTFPVILSEASAASEIEESQYEAEESPEESLSELSEVYYDLEEPDDWYYAEDESEPQGNS